MGEIIGEEISKNNKTQDLLAKAFLSSEDEKDPEITITPEIVKKLNEWTGKGISSATIVFVMTGLSLYSNHKDIPYDPADFGRCYRLLELFPEWKSRLQEVADKYPEWQKLVDNWDKLEKMYEYNISINKNRMTDLFDFMQDLIR